MFLVDTSIWILLFRDRSGLVRQQLEEILGGNDYFLSRFSQTELLQGSRDEREWQTLSMYLHDQDYLEFQPEDWVNAARIYYDLRRQGKTIRSTIDCCIAQLALNYDLTLLHQDQDFEVITEIRPLKQHRMNINKY